MKKRLTNLAMIVAMVLLVLLVFQNLPDVEIRLLFWSATLSKAALILLAGFLGMVSGPLILHWLKGRWGEETRDSPRDESSKKTPPPAADGPGTGAE